MVESAAAQTAHACHLVAGVWQSGCCRSVVTTLLPFTIQQLALTAPCLAKKPIQEANEERQFEILILNVHLSSALQGRIVRSS